MARPAGDTGKKSTPSTDVTVRLTSEELADLDAWIATRMKPISRAEALRQLALAKARVALDGGD